METPPVRGLRYPLLSPPALSAHASNRVCNALALLQCVASHPDTRTLFLNGIAQLRARAVLLASAFAPIATDR